MALVTIHPAEETGMEGWICMTGGTGGSQTKIDATGMAGSTWQSCMRTAEFKTGQVVIEGSWQPSGCGVAAAT